MFIQMYFIDFNKGFLCRHVASFLKVKGGVGGQTHLINVDKQRKKEKEIP